MANKKEYPVEKPMHNPPHPGAVIKDAVIDALGITLKEAADRLDVDRVTLSRLINGHAAVSPEMALRLSKALGTSPNVWLNMQQAYDVWQVKKAKTVDLSRVRPFQTGQFAPA